MTNDVTVYIDWDSADPAAADVCKYSIQAHANGDVKIVYLKEDDLIKRQIMTVFDQDDSTAISRNEFFVPFLNNFQGVAVYVKSYFIFRDDVCKLADIVDATKAVYTLPGQHENDIVVWNCSHLKNITMSKDIINQKNDSFLSNYRWLESENFGELDFKWNTPFESKIINPKAINFVGHEPWTDDVKYSLWHAYKTLLKGKKTDPVYTPEMLTMPDDFKELLLDFIALRTDPHGFFRSVNTKKFNKELSNKRKPGVIAVLDGGDEETEDTELKNDKILENFVIGGNGAVGRMDILDSTPVSVPVVLRGITKRKVMRRCEQEGRDYYYVDTGYFGNDKKKDFHRVTRNAMQYFDEIDPNCSDDRFLVTRTKIKKHTPGSNILICPPSQKAMKYWNLDLDEWMNNTVLEIKKYTDREIVIRKKGTRTERVQLDTMEMALSRDVHCMVTFNSIAAIESLIYGKPVFTMGPNAAEKLANTDLSTIDNPIMPDYDQVRNLCCNLAYQQFTVPEMRSGKAWAMLNGKL